MWHILSLWHVKKTNLINKQLKGRNCEILSCKQISTDLSELKLYTNNTERRESVQFSSFAAKSSKVKDNGIFHLYGPYLKQLNYETELRLCDKNDKILFVGKRCSLQKDTTLLQEGRTVFHGISHVTFDSISWASYLSTQICPRLDIMDRGDLRLSLTLLGPGI